MVEERAEFEGFNRSEGDDGTPTERPVLWHQPCATWMESMDSLSASRPPALLIQLHKTATGGFSSQGSRAPNHIDQRERHLRTETAAHLHADEAATQMRAALHGHHAARTRHGTFKLVNGHVEVNVSVSRSRKDWVRLLLDRLKLANDSSHPCFNITGYGLEIDRHIEGPFNRAQMGQFR
jgi:hypothetical protein